MKTFSATRLHAILICGLAALFSWAFMFLKHAPSLGSIIPFGEDPYDAVGSFGFIGSCLLSMVSFLRSLLPRSADHGATNLYLSRTQAAAAFCVPVTVAADATAMARFRPVWVHAPGRGELLAVLGGLLAISTLLLALVVRASGAERNRTWLRASLITAASLLVLGFYPETLVQRTGTHLVTIVVGAVLLFAPVSSLTVAMLPGPARPAFAQSISPRKEGHRGLRWVLAASLGLLVGLAASILELRENATALPFFRLAYVAGIYSGLSCSGLLVGYAFLRKPLGFVAPY